MNELLELEDPILDGLLNAGNPAYRDARFEDFKERLSYFQQELSRPGVTRKLVWEEYKQSVPDGYDLRYRHSSAEFNASTADLGQFSDLWI